jgi:NADH:ubiquinone oxidoreductase subunit E
VLQDVQKEYGYLSGKSMEQISEHLGIPVIKVYWVATFYKHFALSPPAPARSFKLSGHASM